MAARRALTPTPGEGEGEQKADARARPVRACTGPACATAGEEKNDDMTTPEQMGLLFQALRLETPLLDLTEQQSREAELRREARLWSQLELLTGALLQPVVRQAFDALMALDREETAYFTAAREAAAREREDAARGLVTVSPDGPARRAAQLPSRRLMLLDELQRWTPQDRDAAREAQRLLDALAEEGLPPLRAEPPLVATPTAAPTAAGPMATAEPATAAAMEDGAPATAAPTERKAMEDEWEAP